MRKILRNTFVSWEPYVVSNFKQRRQQMLKLFVDRKLMLNILVSSSTLSISQITTGTSKASKKMRKKKRIRLKIMSQKMNALIVKPSLLTTFKFLMRRVHLLRALKGKELWHLQLLMQEISLIKEVLMRHHVIWKSKLELFAIKTRTLLRNYAL